MVALGHRVHGHRVLQGASVASPPVHGCIAYSFSKAWPTGLVAGQLGTRRAFGYQQAPHPAFATARRPTTAAAATQPDRWYKQNENSSQTTSNSNSSAISADKKQRSRHYYDSTPKRRQRAQQQQQDQDRAVQQQQQQQQHYSSRRDADESVGWWQTSRESRNAQQAPAALAVDAHLDLLPWQEERLLLSAAGSKKKTQVQELAQDLGLDRSEVLAWLAAFRSKPKHEQEQLLAPLQHKIQQQQQQQTAAKQQQQQAVARNLPQTHQQQQQDIIDSSWGSESASSRSSRDGPLPFSTSNPDTGFIPYAERRNAAAAAGGGVSSSYSGRRLSGEVLRTLEGVYSRSPWPSRDVVQGVFELHKLHRDVVLEWFSARRLMDGLPDNPRTAKRAGITPPSAAALQQQHQAVIPNPAETATANQQQQTSQASKAAEAAAPAPVSRLTARELAALRSSLPSPKKFKGEKLQKELGIKAVSGAGSAVPQQIEISGVVFVARDGAAAWRHAWRSRRAKSGLPAQKLDFHNLF